MGRARPSLGAPFGADGPWLDAILTVLHDIADMLDSRLPAPAQVGVGRDSSPQGVVPVSEPAPLAAAPDAKPVQEPRSEEETEDAAEVSEPAPAGPQPPPRRGRGSGLDAWRQFADRAGVPYRDGDSRDDIIAACIDAQVIDAE